MRAIPFLIAVLGVTHSLIADDAPKPKWQYQPELLRPFWEGDTVTGETVLFIKDAKTGEARASVLFPVTEVLQVQNSAGDVKYKAGRDYILKQNSRELLLPAGSKIPSRLPSELRRPAGSQKYRLTHRDGNGEIFFGGELQYAEMQTCITYRHPPDAWKFHKPQFDPQSLPKSVHRLVNKQPLSIVVLGDSISAGANASLLYDAAPYQPPYPELLRQHLHARFRNEVTMTNLSVGGKSTPWGITQADKVVAAKPHLVVLAFGMNDAAGRSVDEYRSNTKKMIAAIRDKSPETEFILVASMLGNRNWTRLKPELFPAYRDALAELTEPGIALADVTAIWTGFLKLKQDWDQTGNGVNHPNDFGHRVYTQVISALLDPQAEPRKSGQPQSP